MHRTSANDYDSPPPSSYFRTHRPWSPDPHDPLPSVQHVQRLGEDSESVDALDLADYARRIQPEYPPSPPPARPFSVASRTTPSLVSSPDSLSSQSNSGAPYYNSRAQRHFSLPPPASSYNSFDMPRTPHDDAGWSPYIRNSLDSVQEYPDPSYAGVPRDADSELDIAHFPAWSRHWYAKEKPPSSKIPANERPSFFDPTYKSSTDFSPLSHQSHSSRDVLPWGPDGPNYGAPVDEGTKEERVRMLEREFGKEAEPGPAAPEARVVGSVDNKGRLITKGPRKRLAARAVEILLALAIAASSIYAAIEIKPSKTPPPSGKPSTYVLYILSVVTFLAALFMFALRPCCCGRRKTSASPGLTGNGLSGLTVLPVGGAQQGKKGKKGKKGQQGEGVQVNLIVDPSAFMPGGFGRVEEGWREDDGSTDLTSASRGRKSGAGPRRRTVFEGLALEQTWMAARKELKWTAAFDSVGLVLWGVVFVWTLLSGTCPPGGFEGYCNAWNVAEAGSCLVTLTFGLSLYFDVVDLHQSRQSPRTRP